MPTVVTSPVGCPGFSVSQAVSSGLVPGAPARDPRGARHGPSTVYPQEWCLVGLHSCLTFPRGAAAGPFVRGYETER
ncbi:hypothetical protein Taro_022258 [Colocasia esculenta]|uniref:Uncharacterized protein n=1 Tax=Colocasia esculenta TaxID=4460 RepID=A0A843VDY6_COLES|nr:hypothetical protein [Colocasia esculenta]